MTLQLVDHRRGSGDKYSWLPPFDWSIAYENEQWWDEVRLYYVGEPWFVQALAQRHPDRRLFAYSEEADRFWVSLGWERFDHPEGPRFHRPLFIHPAH